MYFVKSTLQIFLINDPKDTLLLRNTESKLTLLTGKHHTSKAIQLRSDVMLIVHSSYL